MRLRGGRDLDPHPPDPHVGWLLGKGARLCLAAMMEGGGAAGSWSTWGRGQSAVGGV